MWMGIVLEFGVAKGFRRSSEGIAPNKKTNTDEGTGGDGFGEILNLKAAG